MAKLHVKILKSGPNQTEVLVGSKILFFSYETLVGLLIQGDVRFGFGLYITNQKYSKTTSGHLNKWLASQPSVLTVREVPQAELEELAGTF
jgi:hypothetical protein